MSPPAAPSSPPPIDDGDEARLTSALARLQELHIQLRHLRSTIPRLLSPLLTPQLHNSPEELYKAFAQSATAAGEDIKSFKVAWEVEGTREVRERAKESRGGEGAVRRWLVTERVGWADRAATVGVEGDGNAVEDREEDDGDDEKVDTKAEDVAEMVERWKEGKEGVEMEVDGEGKEIKVRSGLISMDVDALVLNYSVQVYLSPPARIHFQIHLIITLGRPVTFDVVCKEAAQMHKAILRSIAARHSPHNLNYLLVCQRVPFTGWR